MADYEPIGAQFDPGSFVAGELISLPLKAYIRDEARREGLDLRNANRRVATFACSAIAACAGMLFGGPFGLIAGLMGYQMAVSARYPGDPKPRRDRDVPNRSYPSSTICSYLNRSGLPDYRPNGIAGFVATRAEPHSTVLRTLETGGGAGSPMGNMYGGVGAPNQGLLVHAVPPASHVVTAMPSTRARERYLTSTEDEPWLLAGNQEQFSYGVGSQTSKRASRLLLKELE